MTHYLMAIAYADKGDDNNTVEQLKMAVAKDASLKAKAAKDRAFYAYRNNQAVTAVVK